MRTTSGLVSRGGMKSMTRTAPVGGLEVGLQDQRVAAGSGGWCAGRCRAGREQPAAVLGVPSRAAKQAPESNRGRHSQSIEPSRPTRAAVWVSPMRA